MRTPPRTINLARCVPPGSLAECTVNRLPRGKRHRHANVRRRSRRNTDIKDSCLALLLEGRAIPLCPRFPNQFLERVEIVIDRTRREKLKRDEKEDENRVELYIHM